MIFLTVGSQLPFDRLVRFADEWAQHHPDEEIVAQIGLSDYLPKNMVAKPELPPVEYDKLFQSAKYVIGHAGMGTIISALGHAKPLLIMPRRAAYGEHRNDHQLMTAKRFQSFDRITVAYDETELVDKLKQMEEILSERHSPQLPPEVSPQLLAKLKDFVSQ